MFTIGWINDSLLFNISLSDYKLNLDYYNYEETFMEQVLSHEKLIEEKSPSPAVICCISKKYVSKKGLNSELGHEYENDDAAWIMATTFMTFTLQTGYAIVESGMCNRKNEVSIMLLNALGVGLGGLFYWAIGHAFGNSYFYFKKWTFKVMCEVYY